MSRKSVWLCGVLLLTAAMAGVALAQTTGKIRGKVFDKETGEALVGANVIIETTTMGAVAGVDGEFIILNVPPGTYVLRSTYVGYKAQIIRNIRVTIGLTTEVDFRLALSSLIKDLNQIPLIEEERKRKHILQAIDYINDAYGDFKITWGSYMQQKRSSGVISPAWKPSGVKNINDK